MTGEATPFTGNAIEVAFSEAQAAIVLFTGDDLARLEEDMLNTRTRRKRDD